MSTNINLLIRTDNETVKRQRQVKILTFAAIALLILIGAISLVIFLLIQIVNPASVKKEQEDIIKKVSEFQNKQIKLFILNNRVENIEKIIAERKDLSKVINTLLAKTPGRLSVESLEVNAETVSLTASSASLSAIGDLINNLTDMVEKKEIINSLTLSFLIFDESKNSYQISLRSKLL